MSAMVVLCSDGLFLGDFGSPRCREGTGPLLKTSGGARDLIHSALSAIFATGGSTSAHL